MKQKLTAALLDVSLRDSRFCAELLRMLTKGGEAPSGPPQYIGRRRKSPFAQACVFKRRVKLRISPL